MYSTEDAGKLSMNGTAARQMDEAAANVHWKRQARPANGVPHLHESALPERHVDRHKQPDEVCSRSEFLDIVRRERRRADRTKAPHSLVIYRLLPDAQNTQRDMCRLLDLLSHTKRDTDFVGCLDDHSCAVLLSDTGQVGTDRFTRAVESGAGGLPFAVESAIYPETLFDGLDLLVANKKALAWPPADVASVQTGHARGYPLKRPLDIVGASLALLMFMPVIVIAALAIRLTSPGPVIFKQTRLGKGGVPFTFYKFRSMRADVDEKLHREFVTNLITRKANAAQSGSNGAPFKLQADPRITPVGRILRKTSMDEIPQLFNVLKGDMSMVGPRPPIPYEAQKYESWHMRRVLDMRPGITGLWQVSGRSRVTFDEMVRMDLRYMRNNSLWGDIGIMIRTVKVVFLCEGGG